MVTLTLTKRSSIHMIAELGEMVPSVRVGDGGFLQRLKDAAEK